MISRRRILLTLAPEAGIYIHDVASKYPTSFDIGPKDLAMTESKVTAWLPDSSYAA